MSCPATSCLELYDDVEQRGIMGVVVVTVRQNGSVREDRSLISDVSANVSLDVIATSEQIKVEVHV